jgi:hypothetical protein
VRRQAERLDVAAAAAADPGERARFRDQLSTPERAMESPG